MSLNLLRNAKVFITNNINSQYQVYLGNETDSTSRVRTISNATFSSPTLTLTFSSNHGLEGISTATYAEARWRIVVSGITTANYDGTWLITGVPAPNQVTATKVSGSLPTNGTATLGATPLGTFANFHTSILTREVLLGTGGFSFTQTTNVETISPNESGDMPLRGERQFNTSVNPIDFSFTTYIRPRKSGGVVICDEEPLWNALAGRTDTAGLSYYLSANWASYTAGVVTNFVVAADGTVTITGTNLTTGVTFPAVGTIMGIRGIQKSLITTGGYTEAQKDLIVKEWNAPAKFVSANATTIVLTLLTAPAIAGNLSGSVNAMAISLARSSYVRGSDLSYVHFGNSDSIRPMHFGIILALDNLTYSFDGCVLDSATVDFAMDGVTAVTWTGKAMRVRQFNAELINDSGTDDKTFAGSFFGVASRASSNAQYIAGKMSTVLLKKFIGGYTGDQYYLPITGGSITISNNVQSVTPNTLYEVNRVVAFFNGNRTITGNFTVYLRSGTIVKDGVTQKHTASLVDDLFGVGGTPSVDPKHYLELQIGGTSSATKVHFDMQAVSLKVPEIQSETILSINVGFRAQGSKPVYTSNADYDIENKNELYIRYYSA